MLNDFIYVVCVDRTLYTLSLCLHSRRYHMLGSARTLTLMMWMEKVIMKALRLEFREQVAMTMSHRVGLLCI